MARSRRSSPAMTSSPTPASIRPAAAGTVVVVARTAAGDQLRIVEPGGAARQVPVAGTELGGLLVADGAALLTVAGPTRASSLVRVDLRTGAAEDLHTASLLAIDP